MRFYNFTFYLLSCLLIIILLLLLLYNIPLYDYTSVYPFYCWGRMEYFQLLSFKNKMKWTISHVDSGSRKQLNDESM